MPSKIMKDISASVMTAECKFCGKSMEYGRGYESNPYCGGCYEERLEASGAIDLRDNYRIVDEGNGYASIEPIDPTKLWKAERND